MDAVLTDTTRPEPKPDVNPCSCSIVTPVPLPSLMPFEKFFVTSSSQHRIFVGVDLVAARGAVAEAAATTLLGLLLDDVDNVDGDSVELLCGHMLAITKSPRHQHLGAKVSGTWGWKTYAKVLEQVLGLSVDIQLARLGVLGEVEGGDLRYVLILALTLLLLQLEGDTADGTLLNTLHQVGGVAGNLVAKRDVSLATGESVTGDLWCLPQALGGDDGDFIADPLVGLEVEGQAGVVPLNEDLRRLLDGLGADATHFGGIGWGLRMVVVDGEKECWTGGWIETSKEEVEARNSRLPTLSLLACVLERAVAVGRTGMVTCMLT